MSLNKKTLATRTITALVFVTVFLGCMLWNVYSFSFLFFVFSILGLLEFYTLLEKSGAKPNRVIGLIACVIVYCWNLFSFTDALFEFFTNLKILTVLIPLFFILFIPELFKNGTNSFVNIAVTVAGVIYVVLPFKLYTFITHDAASILSFTGQGKPVIEYSYQVTLGIILLIWSNDTFAYIVGSLIGKHKLHERVSPGKTWEGSIGGGILSIGTAFLLSIYFKDLNLANWIIVALIAVVFGTIGDLVESMLKRNAGV